MKKLIHEHPPTCTPRLLKYKPIKELKTYEKPQGVGFFFGLDSAEIGGKKPHPPGVFPEKPLYVWMGWKDVVLKATLNFVYNLGVKVITLRVVHLFLVQTTSKVITTQKICEW